MAVKFITEQVRANLRRLKEFASKEFGQALLDETKIEVKECQRICPKESGTLAGEIHAEGPFFNGKRIWCTISTGPESEDYAAIQHEDLDLDHKPGEQAKFIEQPLKESASSMASRVARRIDLNRYK